MTRNFSREKRTLTIIRRHSSASGSTSETSKNTKEDYVKMFALKARTSLYYK